MYQFLYILFNLLYFFFSDNYQIKSSKIEILLK